MTLVLKVHCAVAKQRGGWCAHFGRMRGVAVEDDVNVAYICINVGAYGGREREEAPVLGKGGRPVTTTSCCDLVDVLGAAADDAAAVVVVATLPPRFADSFSLLRAQRLFEAKQTKHFRFVSQILSSSGRTETYCANCRPPHCCWHVQGITVFGNSIYACR